MRMRSMWLIIAMFLGLLLPPAASATQVCFEIEFWVATGSGHSATQYRPETTFVEINSVRVPFSTVPGSIRRVGQQQVESKSRGCFDRELLRTGANRVYFQKRWRGGGLTQGRARTTLRLSGHIVCVIDERAGSPNRSSCRGNHTYSLDEIDPESAARIAQYRADERRLRAQLAELDSGEEGITTLEGLLDQVRELDSDEVTPENLRAISPLLEEAAQLLEAIHGDIREEQARINVELASFRARLIRISGLATRELRQAGWRLRDPATYRAIQVGRVPQAPIQLPAVGAPREGVVAARAYAQAAETFQRELSQAFSSGHSIEGFSLIERWRQEAELVVQMITARTGTMSRQEMRIYRDALLQTERAILRLVDEDGFRRDLQIPRGVREAINRRIARFKPREASALKAAINSWPANRSPAQEKVLEVTLGLGAAYQSVQEAPQESASIRQRLDRILSQTVEVATAVARAAVSLTPFGDFVDFCELMTGRELCVSSGTRLEVSDRAWTAVGLVVGSGAFWRGFGRWAGGGVVGRAANRASDAIRGLSPERRGWLRRAQSRLGSNLSTSDQEFLLRMAGNPGLRRAEGLVELLPRYRGFLSRLARVSPRQLGRTRVWRSLPNSVIGTRRPAEVIFARSPNHRLASGRYTLGGENGLGGLYGTFGGSEDEIREVISRELGADGADFLAEFTLRSKELELNQVLDLTDSSTLRILGLEAVELGVVDGIRKYEVTQALGLAVKKKGFLGIVFSSAQYESITKNVLIF